MKPALIIGSTCVDIIINIPHLPVTQEDIHPTAQTMTVGGCSHNVAYIARLLGTDCTHISPVGTGMYGDYITKCLTEDGVPITVRVPDQENGCCYCLVEESGERTFMSYHGAEYLFRKDWMKSYSAEDFGLCYICGIEVEEPTGYEMIEYLEENPCLQVFFAPGPRLKHIGQDKIDRILALHPVLHINELEAVALSGKEDIMDAGRHLYEQTNNSVIITLGSQGTFCIDNDGAEYMIPSVPVEHVVDTIGAGDSHAGTVIACLTKDMSLCDSVSYANKVAAAVVGVQGIKLKKDLLPSM